jgi:hypothetical protein
MKRIASTAIVLLASIAIYSAHKAPTAHAAVAASPAPIAPAAAEPVIVRLVSRDKTITISAGPGHSLYSATDAQGKTIVSNATLDELKASHPDIYQRVSPGVTAFAGL